MIIFDEAKIKVVAKELFDLAYNRCNGEVRDIGAVLCAAIAFLAKHDGDVLFITRMACESMQEILRTLGPGKQGLCDCPKCLPRASA
jgi:hypothetical protein